MSAQPRAKPLLEAVGLSKVFGEGHVAVRAVDGVSLSVHAGELVLIMGPSGSGKTTLLAMLGGLMRPSSGEVFLNGELFSVLSEGKLNRVRRENIGFIFQAFNLLEALTNQENVELAMDVAGVPRKRAAARAIEALSTFGLSARAKSRPTTLSGGEKQRVSIARALANDPLLILADEPTANLDSKRGREVVALLRGLVSKGRAAIIVSHDDRIREMADRVLWLEDGSLSPYENGGAVASGAQHRDTA